MHEGDHAGKRIERSKANAMKMNKNEIKRILIITLSNIGDIILTTPVLDVLEKEFPGTRVDVMVGPLGKDIFKHHPRIFKVIVYDKHTPVMEKRRLIRKLRRINYDLIVDLRNTLFPYLIGSKYRTTPLYKIPSTFLMHKKDSHLWKLKGLGIDTSRAQFSVFVPKTDEFYVEGLLDKIPGKENIVVMSPGAKSLIKKWKKECFSELADRLIEELKVPLVMVGDQNDLDLVNEIESRMKNKAYNLAGRTSITQLAHILRRSKLLITNDSAPMHLGTAMGTKVLAIFGPTDPRKYGPRGEHDRVIRKELDCSPCEVAQCKFNHECMKSISTEKVFTAASQMLRNE